MVPSKAAAAAAPAAAASSAAGDEDCGAGAAASSCADVQIVLEDGAVLGNEAEVTRVAAEKGADVVLSAIEAMQAKLDAMKAAVTHAAYTGGAGAASAAAGLASTRKLPGMSGASAMVASK
jgi:hypothetical protein